MILVIKGRCILTADFSISAVIYPTGVALEPPRLKIISRIKSSDGSPNSFNTRMRIESVQDIL